MMQLGDTSSCATNQTYSQVEQQEQHHLESSNSSNSHEEKQQGGQSASRLSCHNGEKDDDDGDDDDGDDDDDDDDDASSTTRDLNILSPVILCILVAEVGERFCFFGFRAILTLYFVHELDYEETEAVAFFAYTTSLAYFTPVVGALLADGGWGRYHTILRFGLVYLLGMAILTDAASWSHTNSTSSSESATASSAESSNLGMRRLLTFVGLFLVCTGTGGIKPCVSAFGADQVSLRNRSGDRKADDDQSNRDDMNDDSSEGNGILQIQHNDNEQSHDSINIKKAHTNGTIQQQPSMEKEEDELPSSEASKSRQVREFFAYFYVCINIGALLSIALVPIVRSRYGYGPAFFLAAAFMLIAMVLFLSKRHEYVHHVPGQDGSSLSTTFRLCGWLIIYNLYHHATWFRKLFPFCRPGSLPSTSSNASLSAEPGARRQLRQNGRTLVPTEDDMASHENHSSSSSSSSSLSSSSPSHEMDEEIDDITRQQLSDAAQALHVLPILAMLPLFWSLYDQQGSIWTLQADRMKLFGLSPEQLCTINPLEIMIFVPLFSRVIYPALQSRGISIAPLRRMSWGFILTAISFSISGLLESRIQHAEENNLELINVFWQLPQLTILAIAEIFVSVTGLEFAYAKSPDRLKAFIMAIFFLTTAAGDLISGFLYSSVFTNMNRAKIMHVCALLMLANLGFFCLVSRWWERRDAHQLLPRGIARSLSRYSAIQQQQSRRQAQEGIELAATTSQLV